MKNILILIPILLLLAACTCDETKPLVSGQEVDLPDVFVVTEIKYDPDAVLFNEPRDGIFITFNRDVDFETVIPEETLFLEGADVYYRSVFSGNSNQILIECFDFLCLSADECVPTIRLAGAASLGIRSRNGDLLDGDGDGKAGGAFIGEVPVDGCLIPDFQVSVLSPVEGFLPDSLIVDGLDITISFTLAVDPTSAEFGQNIKLIRKQTNEVVPFEEAFWIFSDVLRLRVFEPWINCEFNPDCELELIIEDSVRSFAGTALDGDNDGSEGGEYRISYIIRG